MRPTVAYVLLLAMLAGPPLSAGECSDFRAAIAIQKAASNAMESYVERTQAAARQDPTFRSLWEAVLAAQEARDEAAYALWQSIEDPATLAVIEALVLSHDAGQKAANAVYAWKDNNPPEALAKLTIRVWTTAKEAYLEALKAICQ